MSPLRAELGGVPVLVTGATGFLGSHLVRRLVTEEADVHVLVRPTSLRERLAAVLPMVRCHHGDVREGDALRGLVSEVRPVKIFHLAAYTDVVRTFENAEEVIGVNLRGTVNLLRALEGTGYDCFVYAGTCEEYGDNPVPFQEDQPPNPVSPYSASKAAATLFCRMYARTLGCPVVMLRPFLTFGPHQAENRFVAQAIAAAVRDEVFPMTGGAQGRELNYVDDIVEGFIRAATTPAALGEVINLGSGVQHRMRDVAALIFELAGSRGRPEIGALPYRPVESWDFYCDSSKARRLLGWESRVSLEEGLRRTIQWYRAHRGSVISQLPARAADAATEANRAGVA